MVCMYKYVVVFIGIMKLLASLNCRLMVLSYNICFFFWHRNLSKYVVCEICISFLEPNA